MAVMRRISLLLAAVGMAAMVAFAAQREAGFTQIFNGKDLTGWHVMEHQDWHVDNGILWTEGQGGWLRSGKPYGDFIWRFEYRTSKGSNSGMFIRSAEAGNPAFTGIEIQILDDAGKPASVHSSGSLYGASAPQQNAAKPAGEWNQVEISCLGRQVAVTFNGHKIQDVNLDDAKFAHVQERPLTKVPDAGYLGLQSHTGRVDFRNLRIQVVKPAA
jgi:hypothetical protein